jgi:hypothetical protein
VSNHQDCQGDADSGGTKEVYETGSFWRFLDVALFVDQGRGIGTEKDGIEECRQAVGS